MTAKGSMTSLRGDDATPRTARAARLTAHLIGVALGTAILNNCGGSDSASADPAPATMTSATSSSSASSSLSSSSSSRSSSSSSSSSSKSSSSSAPPPPSAAGDWIDLSSTIPGLIATAAVVPGQDKLIVLTGTNPPISYYTSLAYSTVDGGQSWKLLGQGTNSAPLTIAPLGITFDPKDPTGNTFWIFGFYAGATGGLFSTTDGGTTFTPHAVGPAPYEISGVAIDQGSATIVVGLYQQTQSVLKSSDGGMNWTNIGATLPGGLAASEYPYVINAQTYLIGCSFAIDAAYDTGGTAVNGTPAILRTTDGGNTWTPVLKGYAVYGSPTLVGSVLYWSFFNGTDGGILASTDQGQTWNVVVPGSLTWSVAPVEMTNGQQYASLNTSGQVVVFTPGATSPASPQSTTLPPVLSLTNGLTVGPVVGLTFDSVRNSFFGWAANDSMRRLDLNKPASPTSP